MEIASGEQITDAEKERALQALEKLCDEELVNLSNEKAKMTAKAVYHESVNAAAQELANKIASDAAPLAREILAKSLKKHTDYPAIEEIVIEATQPVARYAALDAVRRWSSEKAVPAAEEAAIKAMKEGLSPNARPVLRSAVLAGLRVLINGASANGQTLSEAERNKIVEEYLSAEAKKAASEAIEQALDAELLRNMQMAAEKAITEVASQATDNIAREEALKAAEETAILTSKEEISRLILAEAQRRSAKLTREFLQVEAQKQDESSRAQYCQENALRLAKDAVQEVIQEVADPAVADLDMNKALEMASAASTAVAREYSGQYEFSSQDGSAMSTQTIVILAVQIAIGCVLIWFFFLGGYDLCKPSLRSLLPPPLFRVLYPVPQSKPGPANSVEDIVDDNGSEAEDQTTEPAPAGGQMPDGSSAPESKDAVAPGAQTDGLTQPGTDTTQPAPSGTSSEPPKQEAAPAGDAGAGNAEPKQTPAETPK